MRFSLRLQLALLSLFLLAIPWLGYQYVWELEEYLRAGQEQTLLGTARSVATALHERPALFDSQAAYLQNVRPGTDLYAPEMPSPIRLDGQLTDWQPAAHLARAYSDEQVVSWYDTPSSPSEVSMAFTHMVGRYGQYLYAMFDVTDDTLVWREKNSLSVDQSDHLLIGLINNTGELERYVIAPHQAGWVNAYRLTSDTSRYRAADNALEIQGHWQPTDDGYTIELRFPLAMTTGSLAFAMVDVDNPTERHKQYAIGTANPSKATELGTVLTPSPEIERILAGLKYADSRVWVVDRHKRVLARAGDIQSASGFRSPQSNKRSDSLWHYIEQHWLLPLYYHILTRPPSDFVDELEGAYALAGQDLNSALTGNAQTLWRLTPDSKAVILSAAYPVFINKQVMGAVVVEQTTNGIRTLRNRALEQLFHVILAVLLLGTTGLVLFASRISARIRRLRDDTESVIDDNGKIVGQLPVRPRFDEIGDLNYAFSDVLSRLQQYNSYLENMASRLSHELRTPVAVVRTSLDMLESCQDTTQQAQFITRAQTGLSRLSKILNSMSEATRLEQAIAREEHECFAVVQVLTRCLESYQYTYPQRRFVLSVTQDKLTANGSGELIAQMLDKIITNAVEFSRPDDAITVTIYREGRQLITEISNPGPRLPQGMKKQLLQSMVSVRPAGEQHQASQTPHLGLGLHIANLIAGYHKGQLSISDLPDGSGVTVRFSLPVTLA